MPRKRAAKAVPSKTTEAVLYQALHSAITEHRLPAGSRLIEEQIARAYEVSRTRVRAVLQTLARDRMVTLQRNRGAFVSYPSADEARDVFRARRLLESALIGEAARSITTAGLQLLSDHVEQERQAAERRDRRAGIKLSGEFHLRVAEIVGNQTLAQYLNELIARSSLVVAVYERPGSTNCSVDEHRAVIAALAGHDVAEALRVMDAHLAEVEGRLNLEAEPGELEFDVSLLFAA